MDRQVAGFIIAYSTTDSYISADWKILWYYSDRQKTHSDFHYQILEHTPSTSYAYITVRFAKISPSQQSSVGLSVRDLGRTAATSELTSASEMSPRAACSLLSRPLSSSRRSQHSSLHSPCSSKSQRLTEFSDTLSADCELHEGVFCKRVGNGSVCNGTTQTPFWPSPAQSLYSFSGRVPLSSTSRNGRWKVGRELEGLSAGLLQCGMPQSASTPTLSVTSLEVSSCFISELSSFCIITQQLRITRA